MTRDDLIAVIETLSPQSLNELEHFVDYLKFKEKNPRIGSQWFKDIYDEFAPVREAVNVSEITEDEINQLIDEAIDEARYGNSD